MSSCLLRGRCALLGAAVLVGSCSDGSVREDPTAPVVGVQESVPQTKSQPGAPVDLPLAPFSRPMPMLPVLQPASRTASSSTYDLVVQQGPTVFFPGLSSETYGYNGNLLGPTLRLRRGERVTVRIRNNLNPIVPGAVGGMRGLSTNVHRHGLRIPASADGPHNDIVPGGGTFVSSFTVVQPAATLWYHPHSFGSAGYQVWKGLAGFLYLEDPASDALPLPRTYGEDDFPLLIQDKHFDRDGNVSYSMAAMDDEQEERIIGDRILVNGAISPYLELPRGMVRLRLLNGSDARRFNFAFDDGRTFHVIASDGGFLSAPAPVTSLVLAGGERAEILVDFSRDQLGARVTLMNEAFPIYGGETGPFVAPGFVKVEGETRRVVSPMAHGKRFPIMELRIVRPGRSSGLPHTLAAVETIPTSESRVTRTFDIEKEGDDDDTINGKRFELHRVDFQVRADSTEIWSVTNHAETFAHSFHIHGTQFRILDRVTSVGRVPLPPAETGWKDTFVVHPGETVRLITRFHDMAGMYMYHCHVLQHEDRGMMGSFVIYSSTEYSQLPGRTNTGIL